MVTLTLNKSELLLVKQAVDAKINVLMNELVHTDAREYREFLKDRVTRLEQLQERLAQLTEPKGAEDAATR